MAAGKVIAATLERSQADQRKEASEQLASSSAGSSIDAMSNISSSAPPVGDDDLSRNVFVHLTKLAEGIEDKPVEHQETILVRRMTCLFVLCVCYFNVVWIVRMCLD